MAVLIDIRPSLKKHLTEKLESLTEVFTTKVNAHNAGDATILVEHLIYLQDELNEIQNCMQKLEA